MLASHPKIVSVRETHLFDGYFNSIYERWRAEAGGPNKEGLCLLLDEAGLDAAAQAFTDVVLRRIAETKLGADVLLEKTPAQIAHHRSIRRLFPEARLLHLLRDPRAVVASLLAAHNEAWGNWTSRDPALEAARWRDLVRIGLRELPAYGPNSALLVRYEALVTAPQTRIRRI